MITTSTNDASQRQALEDLAAAEMVVRGDIIGRLHDDVLYNLRMPPSGHHLSGAGLMSVARRVLSVASAVCAIAGIGKSAPA